MSQMVKGLMMREGAIAEASILAEPPSVKNQATLRDPEIHQTTKGQQWHSGVKAHIGADAESGLLHTMVGTAANVADVTQTAELLHGEEKTVCLDAGYTGAEKRAERKARWRRLFGQKICFAKWSPAGCGQVTGVPRGFDFRGFYPNRIELGGACGRRDARWESRQTFPRQAARCAPAHRPQIHGAPCSCPTPPVALRPRVPQSRWRPASGHAGSDGGVARCRNADTWPG